jgi:hypothetical protein
MALQKVSLSLEGNDIKLLDKSCAACFGRVTRSEFMRACVQAVLWSGQNVSANARCGDDVYVHVKMADALMLVILGGAKNLSGVGSAEVGIGSWVFRLAGGI